MIGPANCHFLKLRFQSALSKTLLLAAVSLINYCFADDWPHWLGPTGDSVWAEDGIIQEMPKSELKVLWRSPIGAGYSSPSVANGKVYATDYVKTSGEITNKASWKDPLEGFERVRCYNSETGELLWQHEYARAHEISYGGRPRSAPTVADGKVYTLGAEGDLYCLDALSGEVICHKSFNTEYGVETPIWGFAARPLVDGDTLYCLVGGEGSVAVAFDKDTGKEKWRALTAAEPGYCPPTIIEHGGKRQLIIWHPEAINGLDPKTGSVYWSHPITATLRMSIMAPRKQGSLLYASTQSNIGIMLALDDERPAAKVLWRNQPGIAASSLANTPVFTREAIYGCDVQTSSLIAFNPKNGERFWQTKQPTFGERKGRHAICFVVRHQQSDRYFILSETGDLILVKLTPEAYEELGRLPAIEPTNTAMGRSFVWSHPAFAQKHMFARNDKELICIDLAASSYKK